MLFTYAKNGRKLLPGAKRSIRNSLDSFLANKNESWITQLNCDPQYADFAPNQSAREVNFGHYVPVR